MELRVKCLAYRILRWFLKLWTVCAPWCLVDLGLCWTRQAVYLWRKIEALSRNYRWFSKGINITYSECVSVALVIQHAERMRTIYCHTLPSPLYYIFPHYLINGTILGKKLLNTKCVFWFSVQLSSETFLILRRIQRDIVTNIHIGKGKGHPCTGTEVR